MLTGQDLSRLITGIESGDDSIIQEAQEISRKESHTANNQLRRLEAADLTTSPAYQRAKFFLNEDFGGRQYFSESKRLEGQELINNLELVYDFRSDRTNTVTGERERRAGFTKQLEKIVPSGGLDQRQRGYLRGFLESDFWKDYKSTIYRTSRRGDKTPDESEEARAAIAEAADAIQRGATIKQLEDLYEKFKTQEEGDIFGVMRQWKNIELNV